MWTRVVLKESIIVSPRFSKIEIELEKNKARDRDN